MKQPIIPGEHYARKLDSEDRLAGFRRRFFAGGDRIYLDGNSLGLASRDGLRSLERVLEEWKRDGIDGWTGNESPWFHLGERIGELCAPLVGAHADEVVATGTTTVNIHTLVSSFYRPSGDRRTILADCFNFPTDLYALRSQLRLRGSDPAEHLLLVGRPADRYLDEDEAIAAMSEHVALALFPSVMYRSGQLLDLGRLTEEAHRRGIIIGVDCSHSAGVVPHALSDWGVDFAVWSGYKYLNGGPGCPAFLFVNREHFGVTPGLAGWWGSNKDRQFDLESEITHAPNAGAWQISTPPVLAMATLEGALGTVHEAGIDAIREKSLGLTSYLVGLLDSVVPAKTTGVTVGTPREPQRRGGHVAVEHPDGARISDLLKAHGIVTDFRSPNVIRVAPAPLYNSYHDVWVFVQALREVVGTVKR